MLDLEVRDADRPSARDHRGPARAHRGRLGGRRPGHAFLRHVERTRVLVHVVDIAAANPERDFEIIRDELEARDPRLLEQDDPRRGQQARPAGRRRRAATRSCGRATRDGLEVVAVSAREGIGIAELLRGARPAAARRGGAVAPG